MSDLIERLRDDVANRYGQTYTIRHEAADELERMTALYDNRGIMISGRNKWLAEKDTRIAELETLADARLKDRLIMQESNVTAHKRIAELEGVLSVTRDAVSSLPIDALGEASDGQMCWPIRDELVDKITKALQEVNDE